jgi:hypothetical protein
MYSRSTPITYLESIEMKIPSSVLVALASGRAIKRVPGLRHVPVLQILIAGQVLLLARDHLGQLTPSERHRAMVLIRDCRGRVDRLPDLERAELRTLIAKMEPRVFAATAARTVSPLPVPKRFTRRS